MRSKPILRAWLFLHARSDRGTLQLIRVSLTLLSLLWTFSNLSYWHTDYSAYGMLGLQIEKSRSPNWIWLLVRAIPDFDTIWLILGLAFHVLILVSRSHLQRASALALFLFHHGLLFLNPVASNAEQGMMRWMFFLISFFPDDGSRTRSRDWPVRSFALGIWRVHVCLIYFFAAATKLVFGADWRNGSALYFILSNRVWSRLGENSIQGFPLLSEVLTYGTLLVEIAFPILIWTKSWRRSAIAVMIIFQTGIAVFLKNVNFFSATMALALLGFARWEDILAFIALLKGRRDASD